MLLSLSMGNSIRHHGSKGLTRKLEEDLPTILPGTPVPTTAPTTELPTILPAIVDTGLPTILPTIVDPGLPTIFPAIVDTGAPTTENDFQSEGPAPILTSGTFVSDSALAAIAIVAALF
jgi:hypothetical protein